MPFIRQNKYAFLVIFGLLLTGVFTACQKNTQCTAYVTIVDTASHTLPGVTVSVGYNKVVAGKATVSAVQVTDNTGSTTFNFKLPAVFDVNLTYKNRTDSAVGTMSLSAGSAVTYTYTWR